MVHWRDTAAIALGVVMDAPFTFLINHVSYLRLTFRMMGFQMVVSQGVDIVISQQYCKSNHIP
jgi:hypothetical protein